MSKFNFNPQSLLNLEFTSASNGYDSDQVDATLDKIIDDYNMFKLVLEKSEKENKELTTEIANLKIELQKGQIRFRESQKIPRQQDNFELITKISMLEQKCHKLEQQLKEKK